MPQGAGALPPVLAPECRFGYRLEAIQLCEHAIVLTLPPGQHFRLISSPQNAGLARLEAIWLCEKSFWGDVWDTAPGAALPRLS